MDFEDYETAEGEMCLSIKARCIRESPKALLVRIEGETEPVWLPKSQVKDESEVFAEGHDGELVLSRWICKEKGWIDE